MFFGVLLGALLPSLCLGTVSVNSSGTTNGELSNSASSTSGTVSAAATKSMIASIGPISLTSIATKAKANSTIAGQLQLLQSFSSWDWNSPVVSYPGEGQSLLDTGRAIQRREQLFGILYATSGNPAYLARMKQELLAAAAFPDWTGSQFLDTTEMLVGMSLGMSYIGNTLTATEQQTILQAIHDKGLVPGLAEYQSATNPWMYRPQYNWTACCNAGLAMGALDTQVYDPILSANILNYAKGSLNYMMQTWPADGAWSEGPDYYSLTLNELAQCFSKMQRATGGYCGVILSSGYQQAANARVYMGFGNSAFNFGDAGYDNKCFGLGFLAQIMSNANSARAQSGQMPGGFLDPGDFTFYQPSLAVGAIYLPPSAIEVTSGLAYLKNSWDPNALSLSMKGGNNTASHADLDLGTFLLCSQGQTWGIELGADDYSLPGYWGTQRWSYYRCGTIGQNTGLFDGQNQSTVGTGTIGASWTTGSPGAIVNLSAAYPTKVSTWNRGAVVVGNDYALVRDEWTGSKASTFTWQMHTQAAATVKGNTVTLTQNGKTMKLVVLSPANATIQIQSAARPAPENPNTGIQKVVVTVNAQTNTSLSIALVPANGLVPSSSVLPLSLWKAAYGSKA